MWSTANYTGYRHGLYQSQTYAQPYTDHIQRKARKTIILAKQLYIAMHRLHFIGRKGTVMAINIGRVIFSSISFLSMEY